MEQAITSPPAASGTPFPDAFAGSPFTLVFGEVAKMGVMNAALRTLQERGFFQQCTDLGALSAAMDSGSVTFYVGCDPTGTSLHIGHMVPFFAYRHLVSAGHRGLALIGGGTARIGDPSGKTELRQMLSYEQIDSNCEAIKKQLSAFLGFDQSATDGRALAVNNRDWLSDLNYIDFLRDIGSCFSVNKMLTFESYRKRMETGLSFIEFNYQLLQSYDFLQLHQRHGCSLQIGGDDQWGNIVAGVDLVRRKTGHEVFGLTFPLITTSDGKKMGKTEKGALFLDAAVTPVYDFFQYWRNVADSDVRTFFLLFTFLSVLDIDSLLCGDINAAKERLAFEVTALIHGREAASAALSGARAAFGGGGERSAMPGVTLDRGSLEKGLPFTTLFVDAKLAASASDARRLIQQRGAFWTGASGSEESLNDVNAKVTPTDFGEDGGIILRAGKKKFARILLA